MTAFKVGQRVKALATKAHPWEAEGVILKRHSDRHVCDSGTGPAWLVDLPGHVGWLGHTEWIVLEAFLVPLTDPKADEFIESVKRWGPLHEEPKVAPQRLPIASVAVFKEHTTFVCTDQGVFALSPDGVWTKINPRLP